LNEFTEIKEYLDGRTWRRTENANFNFSHSGLLAHVANKRMADYALSIMPVRARKAHETGDIHIHKLETGMLIGYCHGGSLLGVLEGGVCSADIRSNPAKHFSTALSHVTNYFFMSQLEWAGAQAFSDFDSLLAPFVYYDNLSRDQVKQDIQRMVWDLNFACRQAFQTPFTNLTFNMGVPNYLKDKPVIVGGKFKKETYSDFIDEIELINDVFVEVISERDFYGRPFTFPIPTLNLTKKTDFNSETFRKIVDNTCENGSYFFMNYLGSGINEDAVKAMCCRLNLDLSQLSSARGTWNMGDGTGSLVCITLNMGRLGYRMKGKHFDLVLDEIKRLMIIVKSQMLMQREMIQSRLKYNYLPFAKFYGINLDHYFNTIGVAGLNEFCMNYFGLPLSSCVEEAKKILLYIRSVLKEFQIETGLLWNYEMPPIEGASYRLARNDREEFPDIFTLGTKAKPYYSSLLIPPSEDINLFERINIEEQILPLFSGGTACRIFLGEMRPDTDSMLSFIGKMVKTKIPYFDVAATYSICMDSIKKFNGVYYECPECGKPADVYQRIVGYYRSERKANAGKQQEIADRLYTKI